MKGATGQTIDAESLGGARTHTELSAVAHYRAANDKECLQRIREYIGRLPRVDGVGHRVRPSGRRPVLRPTCTTFSRTITASPTTCTRSSPACSTAARSTSSSRTSAKEMICGHAHVGGWPVAVIANQRGLIKGQAGERPRFGGILYTGSAEKVAYFIETASRERLPLLFVQDVSGFMVGPEAEQSGIIRAGAHFVEAMATAVVPKIVLTVNHASGAGYYAMAGQGFDPDFIFSWPTGRMGVMEGESAVMAVHGPEIERAQRENREVEPDVQRSMESMRADYEMQLDARHAAARGHVDAIVTPEETREQLAFALRVCAGYAGPHLGPFVLPPMDAAPAR